jgi:hypothetical protein
MRFGRGKAINDYGKDSARRAKSSLTNPLQPVCLCDDPGDPMHAFRFSTRRIVGLAFVTLATSAPVACDMGSQSARAGSGGSGGTAGAPAASSVASSASGSGGSVGSTTASTTNATSSTTTTAASSSGAGSSTSSTASSSSSGYMPPSTILTMVGSANFTTGTSKNAATMMGASTQWTDISSSLPPVGLAFMGNGSAVAVMGAKVTTDAGSAAELRYATWNGSWTPGSGQPLQPVQSMPPLHLANSTTQSLSIAGSSTRAHLAYEGSDAALYYAEYSNGVWAPTNEPIPNNANTLSGASITTFNDTPIVAFKTVGGQVCDVARTNGVWGAANVHTDTQDVGDSAITSLAQGAELLIVYVDNGAGAVKFTVRTNGTWSSPAAIMGLYYEAGFVLAPLAAGGAVLVSADAGGHMVTSVMSASAPFIWSTPVTSTMVIAGAAVASGAQGADAELLFISGGTLYSARMTSGTWGTPSVAGSPIGKLAIATGN